jgi:peptidyl-prolyl cis-trans isomerase A (cyclophilin A)/peptidyl-prolyl cis-trans isomerase B (cyclophilin B)
VPTGAEGPFAAWVPVVPVVIERVQVLDPLPAAEAAPAEQEAATP